MVIRTGLALIALAACSSPRATTGPTGDRGALCARACACSPQADCATVCGARLDAHGATVSETCLGCAMGAECGAVATNCRDACGEAVVVFPGAPDAAVGVPDMFVRNDCAIADAVAPDMSACASFADDFNDGTADGWTVLWDSWRVEDGRYVAATDSRFIAGALSLVDGFTAADFAIDFDLAHRSEYAGGVVYFRWADVDDYADVILWPTYGQVDARRAGGLTSNSFPTPVGQPLGASVHVHIEVLGTRVVVALDETRVADGEFDIAMPQGALGLGSFDGITAFDNVSLHALCD